MHVYFSGCARSETEADPRLGSPRYRLFSCHDDYLKYGLKTMPLCTSIDHEFEIMLDSGAFTAWTKGDEVTLDEVKHGYSQFLKLGEEIGVKQFWLINLDVIPGRKGMKAEEIAEHVPAALEQSDKNYQELVREFGDIVLPVFHMQEPTDRLREVCDMSAGYIMLSPRNDWPEGERLEWARKCHRLVPEGIRTHGLGATGVRMMTQVPWYSVDSTSWLMSAMYGNIWILVGETMKVIGVSAENPSIKDAGKHYQTITGPEQEVVQAFAEKHDFDLEQLAVDYGPRCVWNRVAQSEFYRAVDDSKHNEPIQDGLFGVL